MKAGFAEADITPAVGMEKPGGYGKAYVRAVDAPLKVRAAVFDDGGRRIALAGLDTLVVRSAADVRDMRAGIEDGCGIPAGSVLVAASHTHSGGPFFGFLPEEVADAPEPVRTLVLRCSTVADPRYADHVRRQVVTAVREADRRKEDVLLSVGVGREETVSFNRRFRMESGRTVTHPGKGNPRIVGPAGPIDPGVVVIAAWRPDGALLGCVVNFACHGTTHSGGVSPDWIGPLEATVRGAMGGGPAVVFLNGACGDVTQVDNRSPRRPEFGPRWSRMVGARVGAEAVKVLAGAVAGECGPVDAASETLRLRRRRPSAGRLERAARIVEAGLAAYDGGREFPPELFTTEWTFAKEAVVLDWLAGREPVAEVEVQAVKIGPAAVAANPAEFFCSLGLEIKRRSRFPVTAVAELANGCAGYVPDEESFAPSGGGYETAMTSYSNLESGAGPAIVEASLRCIGRLSPGPLPEEPEVASPGVEWEYGLLGPDPGDAH